VLRALLDGRPAPATRHYPAAPALSPIARRIELWVASWGSEAGLRRVAAAGDGWLASAYNTTPERFRAANERLGAPPNALATMWTWISDDPADVRLMLRDVLAPLLGRDPDELRARVCVGPPEACSELLSGYAAAGCDRVYLWPLGDERRQLERIAGEVAPAISG
jgi:alkanesulfonate monooxygenase SsuD/methylene tetrahydromethanopterin reductase-like flavin-dependent oxidoreductase (luciferase family)